MCKEPTITALENINFRIEEFGVLMHIEMTIATAKMERPVRRVSILRY
jgi:hypothetical protein